MCYLFKNALTGVKAINLKSFVSVAFHYDEISLFQIWLVIPQRFFYSAYGCCPQWTPCLFKISLWLVCFCNFVGSCFMEIIMCYLLSTEGKHRVPIQLDFLHVYLCILIHSFCRNYDWSFWHPFCQSHPNLSYFFSFPGFYFELRGKVDLHLHYIILFSFCCFLLWDILRYTCCCATANLYSL